MTIKDIQTKVQRGERLIGFQCLRERLSPLSTDVVIPQIKLYETGFSLQHFGQRLSTSVTDFVALHSDVAQCRVAV